MKKLIFVSSLLAIMLSSCVSTLTRKTATTLRTETDVRSITIADLDVYPERVTYTMTPTEEMERGGEDNVRRAAEAAVLEKYNNADVLVDARYVIKKESGSLFRPGAITSVTVSGHPAHYKNFHSVPPSVWENAVETANSTTTQQIFKTEEAKPEKSNILSRVPVPKISFDGVRFEGHFNALGGYRFDGDYDKGSAYAGGTLALGCRFASKLFLGAGAGGYYMLEPEIVYVPVFGNARLYFSKSNTTPFIDLKAGYSFIMNQDNFKGGLYLSPTLGYSFNHFEVGVNYTLQKSKFEYSYYSIKEHMVGLSLGFKF